MADIGRTHGDAAAARLGDELRGGIEPHRLGVQQRADKDIGIMPLDPGRDIDKQREARRETREACCFERSIRGAADSVEVWQATRGPVSDLQAVVEELWTIHREQRNLATREERLLAELEALLHPPLPAAAARDRDGDA